MVSFAQLKIFFLGILTAVWLSACGGSSNSSTTVVSAAPPPVVNQSPQFTSAVSTSTEENISGTVYTATATDADNDSLTFNLVTSDDMDLFSITSTGELGFKNDPDFENSTDANGDNVYNVTIEVTDGTNTVSQNVSITVTNVAEKPVFTSSNAITTKENAGGVFFKVTARDDENDSLTYSLISGDDIGSLSINSVTGELSFVNAPNFEEPQDSDSDNTYLVTIQASDGTLTEIQDFTVSVTDAVEPFNAKGLATFDQIPDISKISTINIGSRAHLVISSVRSITLIPAPTLSDPTTYITITGAGVIDHHILDFDNDTQSDLFLLSPSRHNPFGPNGRTPYDMALILGTSLEKLTAGTYPIQELVDNNEAFAFIDHLASTNSQIKGDFFQDFNKDGYDDLVLSNTSVARSIILGRDLSEQPNTISLEDYAAEGHLIRLSSEGNLIFPSGEHLSIIDDIDGDGISEVLFYRLTERISSPELFFPFDAYILSGKKILDHPDRNQVIFGIFGLNENLGVGIRIVENNGGSRSPLNIMGSGVHLSQGQSDIVIGRKESVQHGPSPDEQDVILIDGSYVKDLLLNNPSSLTTFEDAVQNSSVVTFRLPTNEPEYISVPDMDGDGKEEIALAFPFRNQIIFSQDLKNHASNPVDLTDIEEPSLVFQINHEDTPGLFLLRSVIDIDNDGVVDFIFRTEVRLLNDFTFEPLSFIVSGAEILRLKAEGRSEVSISELQ